MCGFVLPTRSWLPAWVFLIPAGAGDPCEGEEGLEVAEGPSISMGGSGTTPALVCASPPALSHPGKVLVALSTGIATFVSQKA